MLNRFLLAVAVAITGAALADAAPADWSPVVLDGGPGCSSGSVLAVGRDGRMLAGWEGCTASPSGTVLGTAAPGQTFVQTGALRGRIASVTPDADGAWLLATAGPNGRGLRASDVTTSGRATRTTTLTTRALRFADVASDRRGRVAAAWVTNVSRRLQVRVRAGATRRFGRPVTLATFARDGIAGGVGVAVGPRGDLAVLWAARGSILARIRAAGARRFGPARRVGPSATLATIAPVLGADGRLSVIWHSADAGEEQNRPARVGIGVLTRGRRFVSRLPAEAVSRERSAYGGEPVQAVTTGRRIIVAYTLAGTGLHTAELTARATLTTRQRLDDNGVLATLTASSTAALVAWTHLPESFDTPGSSPADAQAYGAAWAGRRFGAGEAVGPPSTIATRAALGSRAVVSWANVDPATQPRIGASARAPA